MAILRLLARLPLYTANTMVSPSRYPAINYQRGSVPNFIMYNIFAVHPHPPFVAIKNQSIQFLRECDAHYQRGCESMKRFFPSKISRRDVAMAFAIGAIFSANVAFAETTVSGQGYYSAWCNTYLSNCSQIARDRPLQEYYMGLISWPESQIRANANLTACQTAYTKCMSSPTTSPSSPSGKIFRFSAALPY